MLSLIVNETEKIRCITCWAECSTELFQRIVKEWEPEKPLEERNIVLLFSILTGTNYKQILQNTDEDLELAIYQCVAFVYNEPMTFKDQPAEVISLRGKLIAIPKNLASLTIEQNMHIRKAMLGCKNLEELISLACAVYLQPQVDGPLYSHEKAMELEKEILEMPIWQTFAIGFFFLSKLNNCGKNGLLSLNPLTPKLKEYGSRLRNWLMPKSLSPSMTFHS